MILLSSSQSHSKHHNYQATMYSMNSATMTSPIFATLDYLTRGDHNVVGVRVVRPCFFMPVMDMPLI